MSPSLIGLAAAFGATSAAFLPRIAYRLAVQRPAVPRSTCAACSRPFPVGLSGWVRVGSPCSCSTGHGSTVLTGATIGAVLAAALGPVPELPIYLLAAVLGLLLALIDLRCLRLPNALVAGFALTAGVPLTVLEPEHALRAFVAAGGVLVAYLSVALLPRHPLGLGDVKLAAVLALVLGFAGWPAVLIGLVAPHLINGPIALILMLTGRADRRRQLPLGPALLAGALIAVTVT